METQAVAALLARRFNSLISAATKKIRFVDVAVYEEEKEDGKPFYFNVEELLPNYKQNFIKWCNNGAYVNKDLVNILEVKLTAG